MREIKNTKIIAVDHGYGNIKTANTVTPTGITAYESEPIFTGNILEYNGIYYRIGSLKIFFQIKAQVCVPDVCCHGSSPPFQVHQSQIFISLGSGTDIIKDRDTGSVILPEITEQTSAAAHHIQPHQIGVVFIFSECVKPGNTCRPWISRNSDPTVR